MVRRKAVCCEVGTSLRSVTFGSPLSPPLSTALLLPLSLPSLLLLLLLLLLLDAVVVAIILVAAAAAAAAWVCAMWSSSLRFQSVAMDSAFTWRYSRSTALAPPGLCRPPSWPLRHSRAHG